ncbi:hypothetical protein CKM354_001163300 [Cercospora kikuchii]|uniref:histidine kinase n=1 Tax=Cercospora kikuchii TaxID=84275 RepID=A0A9P3CPW1_9PEZI|nr:uncharacterized protein CKM354_001163300 [Cercospora kikuchii]GIZ48579.1 hypothetical protein CKM354_001163300 [Cercospora kikuchii]
MERETDHDATVAPFKRFYERLRDDVPGYEFNDRMPPFHSSYDDWHFFGRKKHSKTASASRKTSTSSNSGSRPSSIRTRSDYDANTPDEEKEKDIWVVGRLSRQILRLERETKLCQTLFNSSDSHRHFVRPLDFFRMPARQAGEVPLAITIVEAPGRNYLEELVSFGANFYSGTPDSPQIQRHDQVALLTFLDFAIGASECLEILHHEHDIVHGEIRGDAFHFNRESGIVRMINFGSGVRSFEHGLTSANWTTLMAQRGVEHRLQFIAPEQTGRLPAEPDARTDIYSLGILFWTMLTGQPPFEGRSPLDIMQNVLSRRIPPASSIRSDVPDVLSRLIQKMTARNMDDRYNSNTGVKHDLQKLKQILTDGDLDALASFKLGEKDVSCFFVLPSDLVGRDTQRNKIIEVIERAAARAARATISRKGLYTLSSASSSILSTDPQAASLLDDIMSDSTSSTDRDRSRDDTKLTSIPESTASEQHRFSRISQDRLETLARTGSMASSATSTNEDGTVHGPERRDASFDSLGSGARATPESLYRTVSSYQMGSITSEPSTMLRTAQKLKRKGRTEIIGICGQAGFGKSALIQSIQSQIRKHGYFTTAKFDPVRKAPFDPVVRVMSSLFRQIFSENDVNTAFHDNVRNFTRPYWGILHTYLELPLWLLSPTVNGKMAHQSPAERSPNGQMGQMPERKMCNAASTQEWLRSGGSNKSSRFMSIFLDVLRLLAVQRFVCFCLDDLQYADPESLELLHIIVKSHIPIVLILTYRDEKIADPAIVRLLDRATKVTVGSFTDDQATQYVSQALHRPAEYVTPLVAVIQEKTQGNPFFVREMLDSAYRKKCIYYCWKCGHWEFSLDKLFEEFSTPDSGRFSTNDFILRRMRELPTDAQTVLAWAAIIGNSFQFRVLQRVMSCACSDLAPQPLIPPKSKDAVAGLQTALSSFIVMPTEDEDRFKFSHDRYVAAADALCDDYVREEMHYVVASSMMKHLPYDPVNQPNKVLFEQARHVCEGIKAIKRRAPKKTQFRELLYQAAETAKESGARKSGLYYFQACLEMLPANPWNDETGDATYAETLTLFIRAAEAFWYNGEYEDATTLLNAVFSHARHATDKAPAAIILSRMYVQKGDSKTAFEGLRQALVDLGLAIEDRTLEQCDEELQRLLPQLQEASMDLSGIEAKDIDRSLMTLGALLTELQSSAYWTDPVLFYNATLTIMKLYLERGMYPQVALGYVNLAAISVWRFSMVQPAMQFADRAHQIVDHFDQEYYTIGRALTLYSTFVGHIQWGFRENFQILNRGLEAASIAGDKILHLLNIGVMAAYRLWASESVSEIEAYIVSISDEFPEWQQNLRGGVFLMGVRQYSRALAGKTYYKSAPDVLTDTNHSDSDYVRYIRARSSNPERPLSIYLTYQLIALYRFGHYKEALELGEKLLLMTDGLLCMRYRYSAMFYLALSLIASIRDNPDRPDKAELLARVAHYRAQCEIAASANDANYVTYIALLDAEVADITHDYAHVLEHYERAVDHALVTNTALDEGLALEHYADWLVRMGAARPARGILLDAISAYRRIGAYGKADHVKDKYEYLLYGTKSLSNVDAATQTVHDASAGAAYSYRLERMASHGAAPTSAERTEEWLEPSHSQTAAINGDKEPPAALSSAVGLDMIDLAGILESSQLLSSELDVDRLLSKLTNIIVDSTGAELVGLVVENDQGEWCVASVGTPDNIEAPEMAIPLENVEDPVARQVTKYVLRFKEQVFLRQVLDDERFSNVPDSWLERNPDGASMISIPILHGENALLGSLYCQAQPNTFTERTVTLLKLLVNQIAISIANALLFKRSERVQASNASMLIVQKQALAQAQEQEKKAKAAEAEAKEMVRLKDEAAKAKSMFLANVSHELRTPLNGVIGMSEMLKATILTKEQEEHADSIRVCADTLLSVINDILDFSKLEAGKMQVFSVPLSLTETISEVVRALSYTNIERNLVTKTELDIDKDLVVMGDPVRLHQILMNLMSNAYKFTARGSVTVRAKVDWEDENYIKVTTSVTDTGIGISQEQQKKLFLPFSQADSSTARSYGGTGLGLSICKAILENVMKGQIWLESTPDVGTTVSFSLTFKKVHASELNEHTGTTPHGRDADPMAIFTPPAADDGPGARAVVSLQGIPRDQLKVCIAEDNLINQRIAINFVKKLGFNCEAYGDGQQAVDALTRASKDGNPFHLVLMDVQMPVLDGYNATREIRKHEDPRVRDILVIAMTASAIRGDREKCLEAGMNNYLAKPVRADTLKQMLESYLHQPAKSIPNLQDEANKLVSTVEDEEARREDQKAKENIDFRNEAHKNGVVAGVGLAGSLKDPPERPRSAQRGSTVVHLTPEEMAKKPTAQTQMRDQLKVVEQQIRELQSRPSRAAARPGLGARSNTGSSTGSPGAPLARSVSGSSAPGGNAPSVTSVPAGYAMPSRSTPLRAADVDGSGDDSRQEESNDDERDD